MSIHVQFFSQAEGPVADFPYSEVVHGVKASPISMAAITRSRVLTKTGSRKKTMELELEV